MPVAAREVFTQVLQLRNITEIWVMTLRLWLTQHHVIEALREISGRLEEMPAEEGFLHILLQDFRLSMKERDMLQILTAVRALYQLSVRYHHRVVTSQSR